MAPAREKLLQSEAAQDPGLQGLVALLDAALEAQAGRCPEESAQAFSARMEEVSAGFSLAAHEAAAAGKLYSGKTREGPCPAHAPPCSSPSR